MNAYVHFSKSAFVNQKQYHVVWTYCGRYIYTPLKKRSSSRVRPGSWGSWDAVTCRRCINLRGYADRYGQGPAGENSTCIYCGLLFGGFASWHIGNCRRRFQGVF